GAKLRSSYALTAVAAVCGIGTLLIGVYPQPFLAVLKSRSLSPGGRRARARVPPLRAARRGHGGPPPVPAGSGRPLPSGQVDRKRRRPGPRARLRRRRTRSRGGLSPSGSPHVESLAMSLDDTVVARVKRRVYIVGAVCIVGAFLLGWRHGASLT